MDENVKLRKLDDGFVYPEGPMGNHPLFAAMKKEIEEMKKDG